MNENSIIHKIVIDYNMGNILIKASHKFQIVFQITLRLIIYVYSVCLDIVICYLKFLSNINQ